MIAAATDDIQQGYIPLPATAGLRTTNVPKAASAAVRQGAREGRRTAAPDEPFAHDQ